MATVNLLPNADVSNDWTLSTGSDVYALLDEDTTGLIGSDGSNAWTQGIINALKLRVTLGAHSGGTTQFTYAYVIVTYTPPLATDNAVIFGCNF